MRSATGIAGLHGVGVVTAVGPGVTSLQRNDMVLVKCPDLGTWRDEPAMTDAQAAFVKVPAGVPDDKAALLPAVVLASLALRSLPSLQAGDVVVQNNGHSAVAQALSYLARQRKLKVVTVADGPGKGSGDLLATPGEAEAKVHLSHTQTFDDVLLGSRTQCSSLLSVQNFAGTLRNIGPVRLVVDSMGGRVASSLAKLLR